MGDAPTPSFLVDHMLIKLGKYLRVLGCDAEWDITLRTHELIRRANVQGRVFLTRNTRLADQYPAPLRLQTIQSTDPVGQLQEVVAATGLDPSRSVFTKCIRCNVALTEVSDKESVRPCVHPNVFRGLLSLPAMRYRVLEGQPRPQYLPEARSGAASRVKRWGRMP